MGFHWVLLLTFESMYFGIIKVGIGVIDGCQLISLKALGNIFAWRATYMVVHLDAILLAINLCFIVCVHLGHMGQFKKLIFFVNLLMCGARLKLVWNFIFDVN